MKRLSLPLIALGSLVFLLAAESQAFAQDPNYNAATGHYTERAHAYTHIGLLTKFEGTRQDLENPTVDPEGGLDTWVGDVEFFGQVAVPGLPFDLSGFGDIRYRAVASTDNQTTGWLDPNLGVKLGFEPFGGFKLATWLSGNIPLATDDVSKLDYNTFNLSVGASWLPLPFLAFNANVDFGTIYELEEYTNETQSGVRSADSLEFGFMGEVVGMFPVANLSARLGIEGFYRENALDKSAFHGYLEFTALFFFLRGGLAFDVDDGLAGVENGFNNGELTIIFGINYGLF